MANIGPMFAQRWNNVGLGWLNNVGPIWPNVGLYCYKRIEKIMSIPQKYIIPVTP